MPNCVQETKSLSARPPLARRTIQETGQDARGQQDAGAGATARQARRGAATLLQRVQRVLRQGTSLAHQSHPEVQAGEESGGGRVSWGKAPKGPEGGHPAAEP